MKKLSDYYTEEEKIKIPGGYWIDEPFNRAFDDGVEELEVTSPEFRAIYDFAFANGKLFVKDSGVYVLGVKLIKITQ